MNTLTPEQLDMIKRLQPFFKERMGDWQEFDFHYNELFGHGVIEDQERADDFHIADDPNDLRIPKPIDWQNPDRGLWGMLLGVKTLTQNAIGCSLIVTTESYQRKYWDNNYDPFTALLKALCEQEEV